MIVIKDILQKKKITKSIPHTKDMIENLKKYYNIDARFDLLKFIKKNVTNTNH